LYVRPSQLVEPLTYPRNRIVDQEKELARRPGSDFYMNNVGTRRLPAYSFVYRMKLETNTINGIVEQIADLLPGVVPDVRN